VEFVRRAEVKAIVDVHSRAGMLLLTSIDVRIRFIVQEIAQNGGDAALGCIDGFSAVFGDFFAHAEVHVRIDAAWKHMQAISALLGDAGRRSRARLKKRLDPTADHQHIAALGITVGKHQCGAAENEIRHERTLLERWKACDQKAGKDRPEGAASG